MKLIESYGREESPPEKGAKPVFISRGRRAAVLSGEAHRGGTATMETDNTRILAGTGAGTAAPVAG